MTPNPTARTAGPVLVVGTGLLGASVGMGLSSQGCPVWLQDASAETAELAADLGSGTVGVPPDGEPELVVVATPPEVTAQVVALQLDAHPRATVIDVASVKGVVARAVAGHPGADRFLPTHPLAGAATGGPLSATPDLFRGAWWVVCPVDHPSARIHQVENLILDLGASPVRMGPDRHDEAVAYTSHVPQVMATLTAATLVEAEGAYLQLSGGGVRDTTRVAASDPQLWTQILRANQGAVLPLLRSVRERLDGTIQALSDVAAPGSRAALARTFARGNEGRARIPGKHGAEPANLSQVTVLVDDEPGQLARLLTQLGELGINLEDLRMEHAHRQPMGIAHLTVLAERRAETARSLRSLGWKVVDLRP